MLCSHDLDVGSTSVAADADRDFDLGFEDGEDPEAARENEIEEGPEFDKIILEGGAREDNSVVGLSDYLLIEEQNI